MNASFYLSGFLCFLLGTACGKKSDSSRVTDSSETPARVDAVKREPRESAEEAVNTQVNEPHEFLTVTLHNSTDGDIDETAVVFGKHPCTFGIVGKGASAGYLDWPYSVGTNAVVRWRDSAKNKREARTEFSKLYDPKVPGELMFTIAGTNVTVGFERIKL